MGGRLLATLFLSGGYHIPYVGLVQSRSSTISYNVGKLFTEAPHLDQIFDWQQSEKNLEHPYDLDHGEKSLDFVCVLCQKLGGVDVGPEVLILPKADLEVDRVGLVPVACKHCHGVVKDRDGVCLATTVVDRIDQGDIEFRGVGGKMMGA
ncbi:hypothetical protein KC359_g69 [Hortaea werneckii]|nr:hypothetical protein KC359_g69 [Hortaea werneckii]KAI7514952.1 hypothetical protein KC347_g67 [Hortaea werneckii]